MISKRIQRLGDTNAQRKRSLCSTISHASIHAASPSLQDVPAGVWLRDLGRSLDIARLAGTDFAQIEALLAIGESL